MSKLSPRLLIAGFTLTALAGAAWWWTTTTSNEATTTPAQAKAAPGGPRGPGAGPRKPGGPGAAAAAAANPWMQPVPVRVVKAGTTDLKVQIKAIGTVTPLNTVVLQSRVSGPLQQVFFQEGQKVTAGRCAGTN